MEQQQNSQVPPMQQESYGKRLWNLWGPIVIKWAVSFGVTMVAMGIISSMYMYSHYDVAMSALSDESVMMALYEKVLKIYAKYTTWVEGAAALATIPVMLLWFHKDRVKEKMMGIVPNKKAPLWKYIPQLLMALTFCVAANNLILIGNLSSVSAGYEETMDALYTAPLGVQILSLAILIPICEELVFRGLLFKRLRMQGGFMQAAMYSAVESADSCACFYESIVGAGDGVSTVRMACRGYDAPWGCHSSMCNCGCCNVYICAKD